MKIINPYTRERVDNKILNQITSLGKITKIICPEVFIEYQKENMPIIQPNIPTSHVLQNRLITVNSQMISIQRIRNVLIQTEDNREQVILLDKLQEIKCRHILTRITDLFIEIDLLGNYTHSEWFLQLDKGQYIRFFRLLFNYWNFRGQIPHETKNRICPFFDPFLNMSLPYLNFEYITRENIQEVCICVMENMIYCGVDAEYRKLGALYILSILTVVSIPARNSMPWLYESLDY